jgi:DNA-binding winged helix-turn-helix (wHTH) protein/TolB-like protein
LKTNLYRFRDFELEPAERRLSQGGRSIALTPKAFDTLVLLVERFGRIVTKEELMRALWPRGYVEDSNLTKHIWFIRRALGESETEASVIETVPKVGYRFVAAVTVSSRDPDVPLPAAREIEVAALPAPTAANSAAAIGAAAEGSPEAGATAYHRNKSVALRLFCALGAAFLLAGLGFLLSSLRERGTEHPALALLGFSNLSANAKDAWVGSALTEMLEAQLNAEQNLQVVPDELLRSVSLDLPVPSARGYSPETLERLRRRLKVDYVVSGSYLVSSSLENAPLRVDLALQDTRSHSALVTVSRNSHLNDLITLAGEAGNTMLGLQPC